MFDLQKANVWKRASALLLDGILLSILTVGFSFLLSLALRYDAHYDRLLGSYSAYEADYGVTFDISAEAYELLDEQARSRYDEAYAALLEDGAVMEEYAKVMQLSILIMTFGVLLSYAVLEFIVPLILKNGQTVGKKIFGLAVMRADGVRIRPLILLARTLLGKYTLETMAPLLIGFLVFFGGIGIVGVAALAGLLLLQILLLACTRNNSAIHDLLAHTVVVDMQSQMIFDTERERIAAMEKEHAERVARSTY